MPLCSPSFRRIKHRMNRRKIHMTVMWLWGGRKKRVDPPRTPPAAPGLTRGSPPPSGRWPTGGPGLWEATGGGGGVIGGVNNLNSIPVPVPVPVPVPLVHHHFPLPLILDPSPQAGLLPPPPCPWLLSLSLLSLFSFFFFFFFSFFSFRRLSEESSLDSSVGGCAAGGGGGARAGAGAGAGAAAAARGAAASRRSTCAI